MVSPALKTILKKFFPASSSTEQSRYQPSFLVGKESGLSGPLEFQAKFTLMNDPWWEQDGSRDGMLALLYLSVDFSAINYVILQD